MRAAGRDGTKLMMEIHSWVNWEGMLRACLIGVLVGEEEAGGRTGDGGRGKKVSTAASGGGGGGGGGGGRPAKGDDGHVFSSSDRDGASSIDAVKWDEMD